MSEEKKGIKIVIDVFTGGSFRYEGGEIEGIRIFPACKYAFAAGGCRVPRVRTLSPVELNEAVQMWMNRGKYEESKSCNTCGNTSCDERGSSKTIIARLNAVIEAHAVIEARTKRNNELITEIAIRISRLGGFQERIDSLGKALREAQDRIAALENNPVIVTYDPRPRSFVISSPLSEGGTSSSSGVPPTEGKPKSRLKTDRVKKVKP